MLQDERTEEMALTEKEKHLKLVFAICIFGIYLFYLFGNLNIYLFRSLSETWYTAFLPVLFAGTLYFCKQWGKWEYRLLVLYFFWYVFSRMLCEGPALTGEFTTVILVSVMVPFFALGITLNSAERKRFLDVFSGVVGSFYFLLGLLCIYTFLLRIRIQNPITQQFICGIKKAEGFSRLSVFDINVDSTAFWFMGSFFLMVYQFFSCRKKIWRIPVALSAAVDYIVVSMIFTRSVMVAMGFAIGLLVVLLLHEKLRIRAAGLKALILVIAFLISAPLVYMSFEPVYKGFGRISVTIRYEGSSEEEKQEVFERDYTHKKQLIGTGKSLDAVSNGRIKIYKASIDVIRNDPSILFRGCLDDRSSDELTRALFEKGLIKEGKHMTHYQNYLIQVLIVTGLPGLLLAASFSILLVIKSVKSFFCCGEKLSLPHKTLVLPIAASMAYMMFEIGLFTTTDLRTLFFFLMSGIFAGGYYDSVLQNSEMLNSREKEL